MLYGCERTWSDVVMKRTFDCALYISSWCCYCCCCSLFLFFPSLFRLRFNKFTVLQLPYWFVWMHVWVSCLKRLTWPIAYARAIAFECMCACDNVFIWITANIPYVCTYASKVFRLLLPNSNEMRMYWFSMHTYTASFSSFYYRINDTMFTICFSYYLFLSSMSRLQNVFSISYFSLLSGTACINYMYILFIVCTTDVTNRWFFVSITRGS